MEGRLPTTGQSPAELKRQLELERDGLAFLIHRDPAAVQVLTPMPARGRLQIGRAADAGLSLAFDGEVSRLHAEVEWTGGEWLLIDDGLSRNGSFVNGERVTGRRRLRSGDVVRLGQTVLVFRNPADADGEDETVHAGEFPTRGELTQMQARVLESLCAPRGAGETASNQEIADELHISVASVKAHLRVLFEKFSVEDLPQTRKRIRLAERALISGAVSPRGR